MDFILIQFLEGLASASSLFLVAAGLSLIFGVTRIVNFAHGSLYLLGAYIAGSLVKPFGFWAAVPLAAVAVAGLGALLELSLVRRLYKRPELFQLLATLAVALIVDDLVPLIWGTAPQPVVAAPGLEGSVSLLGQALPIYDIFLILMGPLVMAGLWLLLQRSRFGVLVRAATADREMVAALGVDQGRLFTAVFALGALLAGLGGGLELPRLALHPQMGSQVLVMALVVVVVGGMDSLLGAFLAAAVMGELSAFGTALFPQGTLVMMFLVMAVVLTWRPRGLLGTPELSVPSIPVGRASLTVSYRFVQIVLALLAVATVLPMVAGEALLGLGAEVLILSLFAGSLLLVSGLGGMTTLGHAAWFAIGAYVVAFSHEAVGTIPAIFLAPLVAFTIGLGFARVAMRHSGIYLAMLTLAFAQIVYAIAFEATRMAGGAGGILGVRPVEGWAQDPVSFYYLTLMLAGSGLALLWRLHGSPFGYGLRAVRDQATRAESLGINAARQRGLGFAAGAGLAGAAGGLFALLHGSVFPEVAAINNSVDGLVMVLLGGFGSVAGPLVGTAAYAALKFGLSGQPEVWRMTVGGLTVLLVLAFPGGIMGGRRI